MQSTKTPSLGGCWRPSGINRIAPRTCPSSASSARTTSLACVVVAVSFTVADFVPLVVVIAAVGGGHVSFVLLLLLQLLQLLPLLLKKEERVVAPWLCVPLLAQYERGSFGPTWCFWGRGVGEGGVSARGREGMSVLLLVSVSMLSFLLLHRIGHPVVAALTPPQVTSKQGGGRLHGARVRLQRQHPHLR